jgi:hypothetical protein
MPTNWREFEQLVARIEETLVPKGAKVKSPDHVRDLVTGRLREVDASIRFDLGSTPVLITVECRKRKAVQDDTWIEQLATKRDKIGAARTIAVSARGFTDSAKKTARQVGIELRTLEDRIGEEIVQTFLSGFKISILTTECTTRTIAFELDDGTVLPTADLGDDLVAALKGDSLATVVATEASTGLGLTVDSILKRVDTRDVPQDATVRTNVQIALEHHTFTVSTKQGPRFLKRIEVVADFTNRVVPAPATSLYEYATIDKPIKRIIEAVAKFSPTEGVSLLADIESSALDRPPAPQGRMKKS